MPSKRTSLRKEPLKQIPWPLFFLIFFLLTDTHGVAAQSDTEARKVKTASAGDAGSAVVSPVWPHERSDLEPDPALHFGRLPNGFRYVLMQNQEPKNRVSMHLNVQVGSAHEKEEERGLAHFLEHMVFNGSTHFAPGELVKYFQKIGMQFGPDANAHTSYFETVYDILLPEGDLKSIDEALTVFKDFAAGALLLESEIDRERGVVLAEKRERDSASYRTHVAVSKFEFPDSILSKRFPIGTETVLRNVNRDQVKAFYDRWYRPDKMILVMVGDFDVQAAARMIGDRFADLTVRDGKPEDPDIGPIHHKGISPFYHFEKEAGNTQASIEVMKTVPERPDTKAFRLALWKREAAHRIVRERLEAALSAPHPPFSSAGIDGGFFLRKIEYAQIYAECSPEQWGRALAVLEKTLRQALEFGFTGSELARVKKEIAAEMDKAEAGAATRNSRYLARKLIAHLNSGRVFLSPVQEKTLFGDAIAAFTPDTVHHAFQAAWAPDHRLILVTGNADLTGYLDAPEDRIRRVFEASQEEPVKAPISRKGVRFPYLPEPEFPGKILRRTEIPDLGIVQVDFENGIRLNLKKTDFEANTVRANLIFGFGRSDAPAEFPGIGILAEAVVNESGVGRLNRHELEQALAGSNTQVGFRVAEDHFAFRGTSVTGEIPLLFQLMGTRLLNPAYREEAYRLAMKRFRQHYAEADHSVEDTLRFYGVPFLAGGDGRFGYPSWERFSQIPLEEVRGWLSENFERARLELSVVGDIPVEEVISLASRYFGSLGKRSGVERTRPVSGVRFPEGQTRVFPVDTRIPKALSVVAYLTEDIWHIGRTRRLNVLAQVLSERLRVTIRETQGAAYSPTAFHRPSRTYADYGMLWAMAYAKPDAIHTLVSEIASTAAALGRTEIPAEELQRAKEPILTGIKDTMRRNGYWLDTVLTGSRDHPEQLEWSKTILSDYAAVTPEEIRTLADTYLKKNRSAVMVFQPGARP